MTCQRKRGRRSRKPSAGAATSPERLRAPRPPADRWACEDRENNRGDTRGREQPGPRRNAAARARLLVRCGRSFLFQLVGGFGRRRYEARRRPGAFALACLQRRLETSSRETEEVIESYVEDWTEEEQKIQRVLLRSYRDEEYQLRCTWDGGARPADHRAYSERSSRPDDLQIPDEGRRGRVLHRYPRVGAPQENGAPGAVARRGHCRRGRRGGPARGRRRGEKGEKRPGAGRRPRGRRG